MKQCLTYVGFSGLFFIVLLATGISGCYYDKEELLYPNSGICDTAAVKYSITVLPIVSASCYSCHAGNFPSGGVKLDTYDAIRAHAISGRLYGAISHSPGFVAMPLNAPKLSNCKIQSIKKWIDEGALNN